MKGFVFLFCLWLISASLIFLNLGRISLWNNNEPRYAHAARNMIEEKNYLVPILKGKKRVDKPILTYWLIIASSKFLNKGKVTEFTARFPFALCGVLCITVVYLLGELLYNPLAGFLAGLFLIFTNEFVLTARRSIPDMALCLFITLSLYLFSLAYFREKKIFYIFAWIFCAFSFLTKGPVGVIIPALVVFIYLFAKGRLYTINVKYNLIGVAIFLLIALPWFLMVGKEFSYSFFLYHNVKHFLKGLDHVKPWYFYFIASLFPYSPSILFVPACISGGFIFPGVWFFTVFLFFTLAAAKRVVYLLPMAPAISLIAGEVTRRVILEEASLYEKKIFDISLFIILLGLAFLPFTSFIFKFKIPVIYHFLSLPPSVSLIYFLKTKERKKTLILSFAMIFLTYILYFGKILPEYDVKVRSAKPLAALIEKRINGYPVYRMGSYDAALEFYLGRPYIPKINFRNLKSMPSRFFIITREKTFRKKKSELPYYKVVLKVRNRGKTFLLLEVKKYARHRVYRIRKFEKLNLYNR